MFKIQTLNRISPLGLELLPRDRYETASEILNPDAILVRSYNMHAMKLPASLKAIARAGTGVNNIPVKVCSEKGIVVFNTPGANANSVKELILAGMFLSSRKIYKAMAWVQSLKGKGDEVPEIIEKEKSNFVGPELKGKKLGVIGLGAIGVMVANDAESLGMMVSGFDPFISVEAAWGLSRSVRRAISLDSLIADSDYISLHIPLNDKTKGLINSEKLAIMKKGVRVLNFARGGLVNNADLLKALKSGHVDSYVTDFPEDELLGLDNVIAIPHLGASTPEAEDNCAIMAAKQLRAFLETGNIRNAVNFPDCEMEITRNTRMVIANKNIPSMVGQITTILAEKKINIADMINRHKGDYAFNIIDIDGSIPQALIEKINAIDGVIMVRIINGNTG
ncbi:MAG: phosphoglycerate dehydrogenase [Spirochaetota bacterium]